MKKYLTYTTLLILAVGILLGSLRPEEDIPMKLVNTQSGFVVVEFENGEARFGDRFLEAEMKESGILIPSSRVAEFDGKKTILLGDRHFEKAFVEIYVPFTIASSDYHWE